MPSSGTENIIAVSGRERSPTTCLTASLAFSAISSEQTMNIVFDSAWPTPKNARNVRRAKSLK